MHHFCGEFLILASLYAFSIFILGLLSQKYCCCRSCRCCVNSSSLRILLFSGTLILRLRVVGVSILWARRRDCVILPKSPVWDRYEDAILGEGKGLYISKTPLSRSMMNQYYMFPLVLHSHWDIPNARCMLSRHPHTWQTNIGRPRKPNWQTNKPWPRE
jgi:hypothetical protein